MSSLLLHDIQLDEEQGPRCERCQGNGELVTDWDRYLHGPLDENGEDAVEECPDCNGTGHLDVETEGQPNA